MTYITAAELKSYKGIGSSTDDGLLSALIDAAQKFIETYTHRVFEADADSTRYLDAVEDVDGDTLYLDQDLCAITSVTTEADRDDGGDALTLNTHYLSVPRNETPYFALKMMAGSDYSWSYADDPENGIKIVGKWAYSTTPPDDIQQACKRLAAYYYAQKDAQVFDVTAMPESGMLIIPKGLPVDVKILLDPYVRRM